MREQVTTPLVSSARAAFTDWQQSEAAEREAGSQLREASWLGKRRACEEHERATTRLSNARDRLTNEWGESPRWNERVDAWVERVTRPRIDNDLVLADAEREYQTARDALPSRPEQARTARLTAVARVFGVDAVSCNRQTYLAANPAQQAARAVKTAQEARKEAELLR